MNACHKAKARACFYFLISMFFFLPALSGAGSASAATLAEDDVYLPTSGWLTGPAQMVRLDESAGDPVPCVMHNQYNNGFSLRFAGGDGRIMAVVTDLRRPAMEADARYDMVMEIGSDYSWSGRAVAHDESILIANLRNDEDFYRALENGRILAMEVEGRQLEFALLGVRDGLARLEQCYSDKNGGARSASRPVTQEQARRSSAARPAASPAIPSVMPFPRPQPREAGESANGGNMVFVRADKEREAATSSESTSSENAAIPASGPAAGESELPLASDNARSHDSALFDNILQRASREVASVTPQSGESALPLPGAAPSKAREDHMSVSASAPVQDRAQAPVVSSGRALAQNWTQPRRHESHQIAARQAEQDGQTGAAPFSIAGLQPRAPSPPRHQRPTPAIDPSVPQQPPAAAHTQSTPNSTQRWQALKGASLRDTLEHWTQQADTRLIWQAGQDFDVRESMSIHGSLETGILNLLNSYARDGRKPAGRIYYDPDTGQKVLLVDDAS